MIVKRHEAINLLDQVLVGLSKKDYQAHFLEDIRNDLTKGIATDKINLVPIVEKIILLLTDQMVFHA